MVPVYLAQLGKFDLAPAMASVLQSLSFVFLVLALCSGGLIILGAMFRGHRESPPKLKASPAVTK
jgi:hypothetical protein